MIAHIASLVSLLLGSYQVIRWQESDCGFDGTHVDQHISYERHTDSRINLYHDG